MNGVFQLTNIFILIVIETSIAFKILFIYLFIYIYFLSQILVDAAAGYGLPPSQRFFYFYSGHPDVCSAIIIINVDSNLFFR